jgi:drug/metabolite transporter (DMT)-like permease
MILTIVLVLLMSILSALGAYFLKVAANKTESNRNLARHPELWLGIFLYLAGAACIILLMQRIEYSVAVPLGALTYLFSLLFGHWWLKEKITRSRILGVLLIVAGVAVLSFA